MQTSFEQQFDAVLNTLIDGRRLGDGDVRATAIVTLCDLFLEAVRRGADEPPAHFAELMTGLLPRVDTGVRARIARRLAHADTLPVEIVRQLAADELAVAGPVLRQSPLLGRAALMEIAAGPDADRALAIAGRADLSTDVAMRLTGRNDPAIGAALAESAGRPPEGREADLIARIPDLPARAAATLARAGGVSNDALAMLFWCADRPTRQHILQRIERRCEHATEPAGPARTDRPLDGERLFALAAAGRHEEVAGDVAAALSLPAETARRMVDTEGGEALVVACRAGGLGSDHITGLVLMSADEAAASYSALQGLVALADRMTRPTATYVVGLWRGGADARAAARHDPAVARPTARPVRQAGGTPVRVEERARQERRRGG